MSSLKLAPNLCGQLWGGFLTATKIMISVPWSSDPKSRGIVEQLQLRLIAQECNEALKNGKELSLDEAKLTAHEKASGSWVEGLPEVRSNQSLPEQQGKVPLPSGPVWTPGQADNWDSMRSLADSQVSAPLGLSLSGPRTCFAPAQNVHRDTDWEPGQCHFQDGYLHVIVKCLLAAWHRYWKEDRIWWRGHMCAESPDWVSRRGHSCRRAGSHSSGWCPLCLESISHLSPPGKLTHQENYFGSLQVPSCKQLAQDFHLAYSTWWYHWSWHPPCCLGVPLLYGVFLLCPRSLFRCPVYSLAW